MSEDLDLQAQIAQLAGRINRHKSGSSPVSPSVSNFQPHHTGAGRGGVSKWQPQRGAPYGTPRGRGARGRSAVHRNRTLVVNNGGNQTTGAKYTSNGTTTPHENTAPGWVSKRDRHMQLINTSVYEQKSQARTQAIEETNRQKLQNRHHMERMKIKNYLSNIAPNQSHNTNSTTNPPAYQIQLHDIQFTVADEGSKLIRVKDEQTIHKPTPKRVNVGGVPFFRSKHGNLYRAGLVKTKRRNTQKILELCPRFTTTGTCSKGPDCRYIHDPDKVAICKDYLLTGKCNAGVECDLSHDPTPERTPACLHFQRGNCTNSDCRYTHIRTTPGAFVCKAFATLGYCSKGLSCTERHIHECPDYANKGFCRTKNCRLPHVDRAGQLRKAATMEKLDGDDETSHDVSSDDELDYDSEDIDSDEVNEDIIMPSEADSQSISQQMDFVEF